MALFGKDENPFVFDNAGITQEESDKYWEDYRRRCMEHDKGLNIKPPSFRRKPGYDGRPMGELTAEERANWEYNKALMEAKRLNQAADILDAEADDDYERDMRNLEQLPEIFR